jgi:hypothetical protein
MTHHHGRPQHRTPTPLDTIPAARAWLARTERHPLPRTRTYGGRPSTTWHWVAEELAGGTLPADDPAASLGDKLNGLPGAVYWHLRGPDPHDRAVFGTREGAIEGAARAVTTAWAEGWRPVGEFTREDECNGR